MDDSSTTALTTMNPAEIVATLREGLLILTYDLTVEFASNSFLKMFQVNREEILGRPLSDLRDGLWNIPALIQPLNAIVAEDEPFEGLELEHHFDQIGRKVMRLNGRKTVWAGEDAMRILLAIDDITEAADQGRDLNRPGFSGGQNSRRIAHYGTVTQQEDLEAVFT